MEVLLHQLPDFAKDFVERLPKSAEQAAYIIGLSGELGAGKTAFVKEVAKALGSPVSPASPTYVIAQRYPISHGPFRALIHMDAYRLSGGEKDTFGLQEYAKDPHNLIMVEWPERLPAQAGLPAPAKTLQFTVTGGKARDITEI